MRAVLFEERRVGYGVIRIEFAQDGPFMPLVL